MEEKRVRMTITREALPNFFFGGVLNIYKGLEFDVKKLFFVEYCYFNVEFDYLIIMFSNTKNKSIIPDELDFKMNRLETVQFP